MGSDTAPPKKLMRFAPSDSVPGNDRAEATTVVRTAGSITRAPLPGASSSFSQ